MMWRRVFLKLIATLTLTTRVSYADWLLPEVEPKKNTILDTDKIIIKLPKIAEKNTAVPITVSSELNNIQSISILIDKKAQPLVAKFNLSPQLEAVVSARLALNDDANIIVLAETETVIYRATTFIKVSIGGCN